MINIADLLKNRLPGNYYAPDAYLQGDFELGLIENRHGSRLISLPKLLLESIYSALDQETGQATGAVLFSCGKWWGKNFYRRFNEEISAYYDKPLAQMTMVELIQCLKECWKTHGWGLMDLDLNYYQNGFIVVQTWNSPFAVARGQSTSPVCYAEAGILSAFFTQLSGRELHCVQTTCESMGSECNYFVLGVPERVRSAQAWLEEGQDHPTIMERLCRNQPSQ